MKNVSSQKDPRPAWKFSFTFRVRGTREQILAAQSAIQHFIEGGPWGDCLDALPGTSYCESSKIEELPAF